MQTIKITGMKQDVSLRSPHRIRNPGCRQSTISVFDGIAVVRCWCEVSNMGKETQTIQYVSTFNLNGVEKEGLLSRDEKIRIGVVHNSWQRELLLQEYTLPEVGLQNSQVNIPIRSSKAFELTNTGNWSTKHYLPMGYISNTETGSMLFWQIEHNGSWHSEWKKRSTLVN